MSAIILGIFVSSFVLVTAFCTSWTANWLRQQAETRDLCSINEPVSRDDEGQLDCNLSNIDYAARNSRSARYSPAICLMIKISGNLEPLGEQYQCNSH